MFVLSAQPIDESGRLGFEDRNLLAVSDVALAGAFWEMNKMIAAELARPGASTAWDLTLEVTG